MSGNPWNKKAALNADTQDLQTTQAQLHQVEKRVSFNESTVKDITDRASNTEEKLNQRINDLEREGTWNFLEAGHGKGAADSIGAVIKRTADSLVTIQGKDIANATELEAELNKVDSSVKVLLISDDSIDSLEAKLRTNLKPLPKTMQIHQMAEHAAETDQVVTVSEEVTEQQKNAAAEEPVLTKIDVVDESLVSKYCVVRYDGRPYPPGVILTVDDDEEVEVQVMHSVARNRYFWPMIDDVLWYSKNDVITVRKGPPHHVTKQHQEIDKRVWKLLESEMDLG